MKTEEIRQLNTLPSFSEDPSAFDLLEGQKQQVPITELCTAVCCQQYCADQDSVTSVHEIICELESQGVVSKTCLPFNNPIWPIDSGLSWPE